MTDDVAVTGGVVLRIAPRRSLLVSALLSTLAVLLPVSALLYWIAIPRGATASVAIVQAIVIGGAITMALRQLTVDAVMTGTEIRGRGIFSPMIRVPLQRVASVDLVPTYVSQSSEPVTQLLLRDAEGRRLFRLRGSYWHPGDLQKVAANLPVAATVVTEPMTLKEFYAAYPGSAYWFENRPWLSVALFAGVIGICVAVAVAVKHLLDLPIIG